MSKRPNRLSPRAEIWLCAASGATAAALLAGIQICACAAGVRPAEFAGGVVLAAAGLGVALYFRPLTRRGAAMIGFGSAAALALLAPAVLSVLRF